MLAEFTPPNLEPTCCWQNADQRKQDAAEHVHNAVATERELKAWLHQILELFPNSHSVQTSCLLTLVRKNSCKSARLCKWRHVVTRSVPKKTSISRIAWIQETQDNMRSSGCSKITTVEMSQKRCLEVSNSKAAPQLIINSSFARLNAFANKTQITVGFLDSKSRSTVKVGKHCSAVLRSKSERVVMNIRKHCSVCKELA